MNTIWKNNREKGINSIGRLGRNPEPLDPNIVSKIIAIRESYPLSGAIAIEEYLRNPGILVSHNRIHQIIKESGMAMEDPSRKKQRKWIRYERKHSNSMWHIVNTGNGISGEDGKW